MILLLKTSGNIMKSQYIAPQVEQLEYAAESKVCVISGKQNEPFSDVPGGAFDF